MKLKKALPIIFLLPVSITYAGITTNAGDTAAKDSQQVCQRRIDGYKTGLQSAIDAKQNAGEAKAALDQINQLPSTLPPCEKQKRIQAISNTDDTATQTNEAATDRQISK